MEFNVFKCDYLSFSFDEQYLDSVINYFTNISLYASSPFKLGACVFSKPSKGRFNYDSSLIYFAKDTVLFTLLFGGYNHERPTIIFSSWCAGISCPLLCNLVASSPEWGISISRIDIAYDFISSQFDRITRLLDIHAESRGIKSSCVGDYYRCVDGRTFYLGSRKSRWFMRIYEKGIESTGIPNHLRFEVELKPDKPNVKELVLRYLHDLSKLVQQWPFFDVVKTIIDFELTPCFREKIIVPVSKQAARALFYMFRNYNQLFKLAYDHLGSDFPELFLSLEKEQITSVDEAQTFINRYLSSIRQDSFCISFDNLSKHYR